MTFPTATITPLSAGIGEGPLEGHPGHLIVYTHRLTPDELSVGLWACGEGEGVRHYMGGGLLRLADGVWSGEVKEGRATWHVTGRSGDARLEFREHAPT